MKIPAKAIWVLAVVWLVVGALVLFSRAQRPTPEKVQALVSQADFSTLAPAEREKRIGLVADQMMRLTFDERQQLRRTDSVDAFFVSLNDEEQGRFLDLTLPQGFRELMRAINEMPPERRKRIVDRALSDLEQNPGLNPPRSERLSEANRQKIISEGLSAFYEEANADVKMDFAPLLEQMQRATQNLR